MKNTASIGFPPNCKKISRMCLCLVLAPLLLTPAIYAQQTDEQKGIDQGNYNVKQSIEFGGRITNISGDQQTYNTMVNLQDGPRLLNFTTEMRSINHRGAFFDRFFFSNSGYGGDPNVVSTLRASKNKWYMFEAMFRHDENLWDYRILANPNNPAPPVLFAPPGFNPIINAPPSVANTQIVAMSPNYYNTRRNMQNYGLTILPDSKIRFRVGYNYNTNSGPAYSAIHEGGDQLLFESISATMSQYRLGVDFRFFPHTNISYDQIWSYYKTDPGATDQNQQFSVGSGFPLVDLGVGWNPTPCFPAFQPGGIVTSSCFAFYNYQSHRRSRTDAPTEQISLQSNPVSTLQISGKFSYTGSDFHVDDYIKNYSGLQFRNLAIVNNFGPIQGRHVASYGDLGVTWQITRDFSLLDSVHYGNWNEPAQYSSTQCSFFSTNLVTPPRVFASTATLPSNSCTPPPGLSPGILPPTHSPGSVPDILVNVDSNFLKQKTMTNLIEGQIQISPRMGAYFGYRFVYREIADNFFNTQNAIYFPNFAQRGNCIVILGVLPAGCTQNPDGSVSYQTPNPTFGPPGVTDIHADSAVLGLWLKPTPHFTLNLDSDFGSADNTFTRMSARSYWQFRVKAQYRASTWLNWTAYFSSFAGQNPATNVNGSEHNNNAGVSFSLKPSEKFRAQLGYNYNNIHSELFVCFTSSLAQPGLPSCPNLVGLVQQFSSYTSNINSGFVNVFWTPVNRLSLEIGGKLSAASGSQLNLNPLATIATAPTGSLNSNWYQPYSVLSYHFAKQWTGRVRWDYYGYHEDSNGSYLDLFAPRNFRGNLVTLSVRYAF